MLSREGDGEWQWERDRERKREGGRERGGEVGGVSEKESERESTMHSGSSPVAFNTCRFITFNCFHGRAEFLRLERPGLDALPAPPAHLGAERAPGALGAAEKVRPPL